MNQLYKATSSWTNIPDMKMDYTDEGNTGSYGYGSIKTTNEMTQITKKDGSVVTVLTNQNGYSKLKARLPYKSEVSNYDGTNGYLYDNLTLLCWDSEEMNEEVSCDEAGYIDGVYDDSISHIDEIYGYWTLSSYAYNFSHNAWYVSFYGYVESDNVGYDNLYGVRPVINLKL